MNPQKELIERARGLERRIMRSNILIGDFRIVDDLIAEIQRLDRHLERIAKGGQYFGEYAAQYARANRWEEEK